MKELLKYWLSGIIDFGFIFVYGHFFPIYFTQDTIPFKNKGLESLTYRPTKTYYGRYKIQDNPYHQ